MLGDTRLQAIQEDSTSVEISANVSNRYITFVATTYARKHSCSDLLGLCMAFSPKLCGNS